MTVLLYISAGCFAFFLFSIPFYRWQLTKIAPTRYSELKAQGRFPNMPDTWEELWIAWNNEPADWMKEVYRHSGMEHPRVFYGRFVDKHVLPLGFIRPTGSAACIISLLLLVIAAGIWLFRN